MPVGGLGGQRYRTYLQVRLDSFFCQKELSSTVKLVYTVEVLSPGVEWWEREDGRDSDEAVAERSVVGQDCLAEGGCVDGDGSLPSATGFSRLVAVPVGVCVGCGFARGS